MAMTRVQTRPLKYGEVKGLAQGHTARNEDGSDLQSRPVFFHLTAAASLDGEVLLKICPPGTPLPLPPYTSQNERHARFF